MKEKKAQFNFSISESDKKIAERLRDEYAINISGAFKLFLQEMLRKQDLIKQLDKK